ncbi:MAG: hypothetical protein HOO67_05930 [Candidatus Peribacteraceae bacterium]|nr:hypothetical protein [Candidatus Peribacteraceae bacterium]
MMIITFLKGLNLPRVSKTACGIGALAGGSLLLSFSVFLVRGHFQALKDVREYALPLAAEIPPMERRARLLSQQMELIQLEASLRTGSAEEKLHVYVLPQGGDMTRLLAFLESSRTFLERRKLLREMSSIIVGDPEDIPSVPGSQPLQTRTLTFSATVRPEGRDQLFSILELSGLLTVGDVLSPDDVKALFSLTETQNYAGIVPVEQFLSSDLLSYVSDPTIPEARLKQAMSSEEFLTAFRSLLENSRLPKVRDFLKGDLGRTLVAQKLWPIQFMTMENESLEELPDGLVKVDVTVKAYGRRQK